MGVLDSFRLDGQVALVTGGSRGIGRAIAKAFLEVGARVAVLSRKQKEAEAAAAELQAATSGVCRGVGCDVTEPAQIEAAVQRVVAEFGQVDVLVNAAGITSRGAISAMPVEEFRRVLDTNVTGLWLMSREVFPHLKARGGGRVINLGSILSTVAVVDRSAYIASKGAVLQLTKAMALEWAPHRINVNALVPGVILTDLSKPAMADPALYSATVALTPLGRCGQPEELAGAALLLASPASAFITGASITVDGGWTAR